MGSDSWKRTDTAGALISMPIKSGKSLRALVKKKKILIGIN
jgi:hypothetical protein